MKYEAYLKILCKASAPFGMHSMYLPNLKKRKFGKEFRNILFITGELF